MLNVSKSFISKWKKCYEDSGIEGLKLSYQGAESYLTEEQRQEVIEWLKLQKHWDLSELECYLVEQYDVVFKSPTSYYELLKAARKSWQKAQKKHPRQDPEVGKKRVQEIKEKLSELENTQSISSNNSLGKIPVRNYSSFGMVRLIIGVK